MAQILKLNFFWVGEAKGDIFIIIQSESMFLKKFEKSIFEIGGKTSKYSHNYAIDYNLCKTVM